MYTKCFFLRIFKTISQSISDRPQTGSTSPNIHIDERPLMKVKVSVGSRWGTAVIPQTTKSNKCRENKCQTPGIGISRLQNTFRIHGQLLAPVGGFIVSLQDACVLQTKKSQKSLLKKTLFKKYCHETFHTASEPRGDKFSTMVIGMD